MDFTQNGSHFRETTKNDPAIDRDAYKKEFDIPAEKLKKLGSAEGHIRFVLFKHEQGIAVICDGQFGNSMYEMVGEALSQNNQMLEVFDKAVSLAKTLNAPGGGSVRMLLKLKHSIEYDIDPRRNADTSGIGGIFEAIKGMCSKFRKDNSKKPTNEKGECMCPACQFALIIETDDKSEQPSAN